MHLRCRRHLLNPPTELLVSFLAISHAVRECSGVSTPTVSVGITKCGVLLQGNALMAAVTRERQRGLVEALNDRPTSSCRLLTIQDPVSKLSYLIYTGSEVSVLPPRSEDRDRSPVNNLHLQAANGTAIRTFGQRSVAVELGLAKSFEWSFTIADVSKSILGADFLRHYGLLVDLKCKRLMDADTFLTVPTSYRRSTVSTLCVLVKNYCYCDIQN